MKPLDGIRVVEMGHAIAGPLCSYQLACLGADVIKIERPGVGDDFRHYTEHGGGDNTSIPFAVYNAGKRSIEIDLRTPDGIDTARRLVDRADVFVANLRPGSVDELGFGWDTVRCTNPRLVHCEISGYGAEGPLRDWPAYDHIAQAVSGLMTLNGTDGEPNRIPIALVDIFTGQVAAGAITSALLGRERTGEGTHLDVAMLDAALAMLATPISSYLYTGIEPKRIGNTGFRPTATSDVYRCRDGHLTIGCNLQSQFEKLCATLGEPGLVDDARFADSAARIANRDELRDILEKLFAQHSADDLEAQLTRLNVPAARNRSLAEICEHEHVTNRGHIRQAAAAGLLNPVAVFGPGFRYSNDSTDAAGPVPGLGEHAAEILAELDAEE